MKGFFKRVRHSGYLAPSGLLLYLFAKGHMPGLPGFSCLMRQATGIPCPTCYLTRATCSALTGNVAESIDYHAFGIPAALALIAWSALSVKQRSFLPKLPFRLPFIPGFTLLVTYWMIRLISGHLGISHWLLDFPK